MCGLLLFSSFKGVFILGGGDNRRPLLLDKIGLYTDGECLKHPNNWYYVMFGKYCGAFWPLVLLNFGREYISNK